MSYFRKYRSYILALALYVSLAILAIHFIHLNIANSDVPIDTRQADTYLLQGLNPYGRNYTIDARTNPYNPSQNNIETVQILQYPPMMILYYVPFTLFLGDVRYGNLVADVIVYVLIVLYFSQLEFERKFAFLYLANGVNFIVNYYEGGNDIVAGMFVAISIFLMNRSRKEWLSSIAYGISLVTKQLSLVLLPYFILKANKKARFILISLIIAAAIAIPFFPQVIYNVVLGIFYSRIPLFSYLLIFYPFIFMVVVEKYARPNLKDKQGLPSQTISKV